MNELFATIANTQENLAWSAQSAHNRSRSSVRHLSNVSGPELAENTTRRHSPPLPPCVLKYPLPQPENCPATPPAKPHGA